MLQFVLLSNVDQHVDGPREGERRTSPRQTNQSSTGQCVDHASRSFKQNELFFTGTFTIHKRFFLICHLSITSNTQFKLLLLL